MKWNNILIAVVFIIMLSGLVNAAYWVNDPADCPIEYQSQNPTVPGEKLCGYDEGIAFWYDMSSLSAPVGSSNVSTTNYDGVDGGYVIDCTYYDGSSPHCDNSGAFWCDRNSTCFDVNRNTTCTGGSFGASSCSLCISGYTYCDGSYTDGDGCEIDIDTTSYPGEGNAVYNSSCQPECTGNYLDCNGDLGSTGDGCEILNGGDCFVGELPGSYQGCSGSEGNCVVQTGYFETGTESKYSTSNALLWGSQYGSGYMINMSNGSITMFGVNNSGCVMFPDGSGQCSAASDTYTAGTGLTLGGTEFSVTDDGIDGAQLNDTINLDAPMNIIGNDFAVNNTNLYVDVSGGNVGIGTATPGSNVRLHIVDTDNVAMAIENTVQATWSRFFAGGGGAAFTFPRTKAFYIGPAASVTSDTLDAGKYMVIDGTDGYVGIGTATPSEKLVVDGNINVTSGNDVCVEGGNCLSDVTTYSENSKYLTLSSSVFGFDESELNTTIEALDNDTTYSAGTGIGLSGTTFSVAGNTALTADADGLSVTDDGIDGAQLADSITLDADLNITQSTYNVNFEDNLLFIQGGQDEVGIGRIPQAKLHVNGTVLVDDNINITGDLFVNGDDIDLYDGQINVDSGYIGYNSCGYGADSVGICTPDGVLTLGYSGPKIYVKSSGIGISYSNGFSDGNNPDTELHVDGGVCIDDDAVCDDPGDGNLYVKGDGEFGNSLVVGSGIASGTNSVVIGGGYAEGENSISINSMNASGDYSTAIGSSNIAQGHYSTAMGRGMTVIGNYSFGINLDETELFSLNQNQAMSIMGGNVGIGTTKPGVPLQVEGNAQGNAFRIEENAGDGEYFTIGVDSDGKLGFYQDDGDILLDLSDDCQTIGINQEATCSGYPTLQVFNTGNGFGWTGWFDSNYSDSFIGITTNNSASGQFDDNGIGIVSTSTHKEMVFRVNDTNILRIEDTGEVGIGTADPETALEVDGEIRTTPRSTPSACNVKTEGAIFYNSSDNKFYGCNGTTWVSFRQ